MHNSENNDLTPAKITNEEPQSGEKKDPKAKLNKGV